MNSGAGLKDELQALWQSYEQALEIGRPESEVDAWIGRMEALVPHSMLSDLIFWGERERTVDEAIEEAIHREGIWRSGGELPLLIYLEGQLSSALTESDLQEPFRTFADNQLQDIRNRIAERAVGQSH